MTATPPRRGGPTRGLVAASLILLFAVLPALLAGIRIDAPAAPGEFHRVLQGLEPEEATPELRGSRVARMFYAMTQWGEAPADAEAPDEEEVRSLLAGARLAQIAGVLALALMTYLAVTLARGRSRALLACAALACLPAVYQEGYVLRPETPAAMFAMLSLLLMQGLPGLLRQSRSRVFGASAVIAVSAATTGLAVTALPTYEVYLLVPGAVMLFVALLVSVRFIRVVKRRRFMVLPMRAVTFRLLPWVALGFSTLVLTYLLLTAGLDPGVERLHATSTTVGLLPDAPLPRYALLAVLVVGALAWTLRAGLSIGRRGRVDAEFLLFVHVAAVLLHRWLSMGEVDALPAAIPASILIAEGVGATAFAAFSLVWKRQPGPTNRP